MADTVLDTFGNDLGYEVLVISLKNALERRSSISEELATLNIPFVFFDAVNGNELRSFPNEYDRKKRINRYGHDLLPGEIGCFLSHKAIWEYVVNTQKTVLVLEDDAHIHAHLFESLRFISSFNKPWDFLRLCGLRKEATDQLLLASCPGFNVVEELTDPSLTTGYVLKPSGAVKLLKAARHFYLPVDNFIELRRHNKLVSLSIFPYPVTCKGMASTIGSRQVEKTTANRLRRLWFRAWHDLENTIWIIGRKIAHAFGVSHSL